MNNFSRTLLASVLITANCLLLTACGGGSRGPGGVRLSTSNRVVEHILNELERLDPYNSTGEDEKYIEEHIYERLLRMDPKTMQMNVPWLAESMPTESDDHLTYDFTLRKGTKFADGKELTGADV